MAQAWKKQRQSRRKHGYLRSARCPAPWQERRRGEARRAAAPAPTPLVFTRFPPRSGGSGGTGRDREDGESSAILGRRQQARAGAGSKGRAQVWEDNNADAGDSACCWCWCSLSLSMMSCRQSVPGSPQRTVADVQGHTGTGGVRHFYQH